MRRDAGLPPLPYPLILPLVVGRDKLENPPERIFPGSIAHLLHRVHRIRRFPDGESAPPALCPDIPVQVLVLVLAFASLANEARYLSGVSYPRAELRLLATPKWNLTLRARPT